MMKNLFWLKWRSWISCKYSSRDNCSIQAQDDHEDDDDDVVGDDVTELEELDLGCLISPGSLFQLSASHQSEYCQVVSQDEDWWIITVRSTLLSVISGSKVLSLSNLVMPMILLLLSLIPLNWTCHLRPHNAFILLISYLGGRFLFVFIVQPLTFTGSRLPHHLLMRCTSSTATSQMGNSKFNINMLFHECKILTSISQLEL